MHRTPIAVEVQPYEITISSATGPDRSIPMDAIQKGLRIVSRYYRNRRLGEFLKELSLTEGRNTGIPTIQRELARNGSPAASFETDEDRLSFLVRIPCHEGEEGVSPVLFNDKERELGDPTCRQSVTKQFSTLIYMRMAKGLDIQVKEGLKAYLASGVEDQVDYQKFYLYSIVTDATDYPENNTVNPQLYTVNDTVNTQPDTVTELKEGLKRIYTASQKNPEMTHTQLMEIFNISESTAKRATRDLKKLGYIEIEGYDKTGRWVILKNSQYRIMKVSELIKELQGGDRYH